jgi:hypothetical protein
MIGMSLPVKRIYIAAKVTMIGRLGIGKFKKLPRPRNLKKLAVLIVMLINKNVVNSLR